jgi:hypothetical protein
VKVARVRVPTAPAEPTIPYNPFWGVTGSSLNLANLAALNAASSLGATTNSGFADAALAAVAARAGASGAAAAVTSVDGAPTPDSRAIAIAAMDYLHLDTLVVTQEDIDIDDGGSNIRNGSDGSNGKRQRVGSLGDASPSPSPSPASSGLSSPCSTYMSDDSDCASHIDWLDAAEFDPAGDLDQVHAPLPSMSMPVLPFDFSNVVGDDFFSGVNFAASCQTAKTQLSKMCSDSFDFDDATDATDATDANASLPVDMEVGMYGRTGVGEDLDLEFDVDTMMDVLGVE